MKRKSINSLGETELEVLNIVWSLKSATVGEVREKILQHREVAYTTIMTVMRNLADKGYLSYKKHGKSYVYSVKKSAGDVRRGILREIVSNAFAGSPLSLVRTLVEDENLSPDELEEIKSIIHSLDAEGDRND